MIPAERGMSHPGPPDKRIDRAALGIKGVGQLRPPVSPAEQRSVADAFHERIPEIMRRHADYVDVDHTTGERSLDLVTPIDQEGQRGRAVFYISEKDSGNEGGQPEREFSLQLGGPNRNDTVDLLTHAWSPDEDGTIRRLDTDFKRLTAGDTVSVDDAGRITPAAAEELLDLLKGKLKANLETRRFEKDEVGTNEQPVDLAEMRTVLGLAERGEVPEVTYVDLKKDFTRRINATEPVNRDEAIRAGEHFTKHMQRVFEREDISPGHGGREETTHQTPQGTRVFAVTVTNPEPGDSEIPFVEAQVDDSSGDRPVKERTTLVFGTTQTGEFAASATYQRDVFYPNGARQETEEATTATLGLAAERDLNRFLRTRRLE